MFGLVFLWLTVDGWQLAVALRFELYALSFELYV
jgi:hypothetical protein